MIKRASLLLIALGALIALAKLADFNLLFQVFETMPKRTIAILIGLFIASSIAKGLRWAFYLRSAHLNIRRRDAITSYIAGFTTSPLPGGSWLAPRLAQEHGEVRMRQAASALFVSFIGDAISISMVALAMFAVTRQPAYSFLLPLTALGMGVLLLVMGRSSLVWRFVSQILSRWRLTQRFLPQEKDIQSRIRALLRPSVIGGGIAFSLVTTLLSVIALYVLVDALTFRGISITESLFVRSASESTAIAFPFIGGIGIVDSSLTGLLVSLGLGLQRATFLALVNRTVDLVFKVLVGSLVLFLRYDQFLLNVLDVPRRTRGACNWALRMPGTSHAIQWLGSIHILRYAVEAVSSYGSTDPGDDLNI